MSSADASASESVMVAFLPTTSEWCKIELPHMTLVYAGAKDKLTAGDFNSLAKDAAMIALLGRPFALQVTHLDVFGPEDELVDVLRFRLTPELVAMRRVVERWNASEHPFRPHATIGPHTGSVSVLGAGLPTVIGFDRVMVGWGDEQLVFKL